MALSLLILVGCKEDEPEPPACDQSNWTGTYVGSQDCDGTVEDVTVTITSSGTTDVIFAYELSGLEVTYDPLTINGCSLDATNEDMGLSLTVNASISGDEFSLTEVLSDGTTTSNCVITATRQ